MWAKRILANSSARDSALVVLLALGETAKSDRVTLASVPDLARWAKVSERQVKRDLQALIRAGEITQHAPAAGRGKPARYRLTVGSREKFWSQNRKAKRVTSTKPLSRV